MKYTVLCLIFFFSYFISPIGSQPLVISGQTIKNNQQWSGEVIIEGDVEIAAGGRLIIAPGTTVSFKPNTDKRKSGYDKARSELIVNGILVARGKENELIRFVSSSENPQPGDWLGITVNNKKRPSTIEYAVFEHAYNAISIRSNKSQLSHLIIQYNFNAGIVCELRSIPEINNSYISDNNYAGIICATASRPRISRNIIRANQFGIVNYRTAKPNLGSLARNRQYNHGVNIFIENREYDIYHRGTSDIKAENNNWGRTTSTQVKQKIYDFDENEEYGKVDILPLLRRVNFEDTDIYKIRLAYLADYSSRLPGAGGAYSTHSPATDAGPVAAENKVPPEPGVNNINQDSSGQVFLDVFLDNERQVTSRVSPEIDESEGRSEISGQIIIGVTVDKNGKVASAMVLKGLNKYYDSLSLDAAKKFLFKPGTINGVPVKFSTSLIFDY